MPTKTISKKQVARQRASLKKLKSLGLFTGDLRKKPTARTLRIISKFDAVLKGKASVVTPDKPKTYSKIFDVVGKNVVVPRRKGERIAVNKAGEITSTRKVRGRTVKSTFKRIPKGQPEKIKKPAKREVFQYAIPLNFAGGRRYVRFPNWDELQKFLAAYNYKGWEDFVVEEYVGEDLTDDELEARGERQQKKPRKKSVKKTAKKTAKKTVKKSKKKTVKKSKKKAVKRRKAKR